MSSETRSQLHLALMLNGTGGHLGARKLPEAEYDGEDFELILRTARLAETAKFDMLFVADAPVSTGPHSRYLEAITQLAALAGLTDRIGLGATVSTTYFEPYNLARMMGSIDHISGGRTAWNVVTTSGEEASKNFGQDEHPPKLERYQRAAEFVAVCKGLWDTWEDDDGGPRDFDPDKWHTLNHRGTHFSVKGPLNMSRPPQGYPVIIQAGASETGIPFAAELGEVIFTVQDGIESTKAFAERIRDLAAKAGRDPQLIRIMPGVCPFVADSEEEAQQMLWRLSEYIDEHAAWEYLNNRLGLDARELDPEGPLPTIPWEEMRGHTKTLTAVAKRYNFNVRQVRDYVAAASGHRLLFGTPQAIADELENWFRSGAADGFVVIPPYLTAPLAAFTEKVIPILQERGLFRTEYDGTTLREHLGLPRPTHPHSQRQAA
jgi:N-acetyl-S-(2-succino)cysteine monooxygenase